MIRVCVTPSWCWRSLQVWFRWNTVTRCCWCPHSKEHCCTAPRPRRSSSWEPNHARGTLPGGPPAWVTTSHFHSLWLPVLNLIGLSRLVEAAAGLELASCRLFVSRVTWRCLLPDLVFGCGGLTSEDRWKTPIY